MIAKNNTRGVKNKSQKENKLSREKRKGEALVGGGTVFSEWKPERSGGRRR